MMSLPAKCRQGKSLFAAFAAAARLFAVAAARLLVAVVFMALAARFHMLLVGAALFAARLLVAASGATARLLVALIAFLIRVHHISFEKLKSHEKSHPPERIGKEALQLVLAWLPLADVCR